jgi:hypothetical protein
MPEPADAAPAGTRFTLHVVVTVTDPADGLGLEPISPPRLSRVFGAVLRKLVADDPDSQADVGAVSVTLQQEPAPDADPGMVVVDALLGQPPRPRRSSCPPCSSGNHAGCRERDPGGRLAGCCCLWPEPATEPTPLPMIPLPSGGIGRGGGPDQ